MAARLNRYAFINAKLRARLGSLIDEAKLAAMARARSLQEAINVLRETDYAEIEALYGQTNDLALCEYELGKKEIGLYKDVERYVDGEVLDLVRALSLKFEVENLKQALRLWFEHAVKKRNIEPKIKYLLTDTIKTDLHAIRIADQPTIEAVAEILADTPYGRIVADNADKLSTSGNLFHLEVALDKFYFQHLETAFAGLDKRDSEIARKLMGVEIDLENMERLVRFLEFYELPAEEALQYLIPFGSIPGNQKFRRLYDDKKSGALIKEYVDQYYPALTSLFTQGSQSQMSRLVFLEKILGEIILSEIRRVLSGYPFTIGIVLSYFILKQRELRKVSAILNAKNFELTEERLQSLL